MLPKGGSILNTCSIHAYEPSENLAGLCADQSGASEFDQGNGEGAREEANSRQRCGSRPMWTPLIPSTMPGDEVKQFGKNKVFERPAQPAELAPIYSFPDFARGDLRYGGDLRGYRPEDAILTAANVAQHRPSTGTQSRGTHRFDQHEVGWLKVKGRNLDWCCGRFTSDLYSVRCLPKYPQSSPRRAYSLWTTIAFAWHLSKAFAVQYIDTATRVVDQSGFVQYPRCHVDRRAAGSQHGRLTEARAN